jgi:hypothetical protein
MKAENLNNMFRNKVKYSSQEELYEDIDGTIQFIIDTLKMRLPLPLKFQGFAYGRDLIGGDIRPTTPRSSRGRVVDYAALSGVSTNKRATVSPKPVREFAAGQRITRATLNDMSKKERAALKKVEAEAAALAEAERKAKEQAELEEAERLEEEQAEAEAQATAIRGKDEVAERNRFKLVFTPLGLEVVKKADIKTALDRLYKTDPNIVGMGKVNFFKYIGAKYMNITRDETGAFLDSKMNYQMTRPTNKHINKPLLSDFPNQKWGIDLIDTSSYHKHNRGIRYVVTVVDFFSRKTWLGMTVKKSADAIRDAFKEILTRAEVSPNFLVADNGTEFKASFDTFCKAEGIKVIRTATYSPQSNSIVERKNQEVRKRIRAFMTKNQSLHWTQHLGDIERALNATHNSTTGTSADRLWSVEKQALNDPEKLKSQIRQQDRAVRLIDKFNALQFKTGDYVRMLMSSIFSNI